VAINTDEYLSRLQESVADAVKLMESGGWQQAEKILAEALQSFTDAGLLLEPMHEWLRLRSLWGACVFQRGGFEEAIVIFQQASEARRSAGLLDWSYVRQRRYLAVAKRGLCDFSSCLDILAEALAIAKQSKMEDLRKELEDDIQVTEAISSNAVHASGVATTMTLIGSNGVEIMGDDRVFLRGCESLRFKCHVSDYSLYVEDPYRVRVDLRFTVDNGDCLSSWPDTRYPGSRTPVLFGLLLPKGARVNHGDFVLEVNDPDPGWREKFFFLQNQFATMFHPSSYPPAGFYPIPLCKSYKYIRGDFSLFRTRIPPHAEVHFSGVITFHPSAEAMAEGGQVHLQTSLFLPFGAVSFNGVKVLAAHTLIGARISIVASSFLNDRIKFNPSVTPLVADDDPEVGEKKNLPLDECQTGGYVLRDLDLLSVQVVGKLAGSLALSIQPETHVIPSGIFNEMKRTERRAQGGGFDITEAATKPVPLVSCVVVNNEELRKRVTVEILSKDLQINDSQVVELGAYESRTLRVKPPLVNETPLFGPQTDADVDLGPRPVELEVRVHERRMAGILRGRELAHRRVELCVLPPDYMVWGIANHHDGQFVNLRMLIARWVTPGIDEVKAFLDKHSILLPRQGDRGLKDIYESLLTYGFVYDNSRLNFGSSMEHDYQRVRRPITSLVHRHVNCIDSTVLLASLCERLGYQPAIVFVPGHAFLGVLFGSDLRHIERIICVESTGLCPHWSKRTTGFQFDPSSQGRSLSYDEATYVGLAQFSESKEKLFGPGRDIKRYQLIPVGEARSEGITGFEEP
jgi:hypothetical protein